MNKYGLPYRNASGLILSKDTDLVESMLDTVSIFPEVHIVTTLKNGRMVNRYQAENAACHYLYLGNADPDIEFTSEFSMDDFTPEEIEASEKRHKEFRNRPFTPIEIAAINFGLNAILNSGKK